MKILLLSALLCMSMGLCAQDKSDTNPYFEEPYAIKANGEFIDVTTGHSAPLVYDFNKDGIDDLLVGEFGEVDYDGIDEGKSHEYVQGRCRVYINHGTNEQPVYKDFTYLSAGGVPMAVPVTCCISFVPRIVDMDGDGIDDVISGSYTSEMFIWKGKGNQEFEPGRKFQNLSGGDLLLPDEISSMCVDPFDWDGDGDYDLFASTRGDGFFVFENIGDAKNYKFKDAVQVPMKDNVWWLLYYRPYDWDGDGLFDLVGAKEFGDIIWSKNIGTPGHPEFAPLEVLRKNPKRNGPTEDVRPIGGRPKLWICDYNRDGKDDLLVGDVYGTEKILWKLTPKEEMKLADLHKQLTQLSAGFADKYPELWDFMSHHAPEEYTDRKCISYEKKRIGIWDKIEKLNQNKELKSHGYVWVFLRK